MKIKKALYKEKKDARALLLATTYLFVFTSAFMFIVPVLGTSVSLFAIPIFVLKLTILLFMSAMPMPLHDLFAL